MDFIYTPSPFMLPESSYDKAKADRAVAFIQDLKHTKGKWDGKPFLLLNRSSETSSVSCVLMGSVSSAAHTLRFQRKTANQSWRQQSRCTFSTVMGKPARRCMAAPMTGIRHPSYSMLPSAWWKNPRRSFEGQRSLRLPSGL